MDGFNPTNWPMFPRNFRALCDEKGIKAFIEEGEEKVCRYISQDAIIDAIIDYSFTNLSHIPSAQLTHDEATNCFKIWRALSPEVTFEILPVAQKGEDVRCWHRLPFNFEEVNPEKTPTFNELFSRTSNAEALKTWIGSLFQKDSDRQQYVWIYGEGNNGKGALARFLHRIMGPSYCAQQPPTYGDKFWTAGLLGSRLVVFADCSDASFPTTGLFKSITGGDLQKIEEKGKQPYSAELFCKMLFLSNEKPTLSGGMADKRRAIYCEMEAINTKPMATSLYDKLLYDEGPYFLAECVALYKKHCPYHDAIPVDILKLEDLIEHNEETYSVLFEKYFAFTSDEEKKKNERAFVTPRRIQEILDEANLSFKQKRAFHEFLLRYHVRRVRVKIKENLQWRYLGMREKTMKEKELDSQENNGKPDAF